MLLATKSSGIPTNYFPPEYPQEKRKFPVVIDLEWVSHLSNLRYLDMSLVVDWLSSISKIPCLSELYLSNCGLQQVTPKSIAHLNSSILLKSLHLAENSFKETFLQVCVICHCFKYWISLKIILEVKYHNAWVT